MYTIEDIIKVIDIIVFYRVENLKDRERIKDSILRHIERRGLDSYLSSISCGKHSEVINYIRDQIKRECWEKAARSFDGWTRVVRIQQQYS